MHFIRIFSKQFIKERSVILMFENNNENYILTIEEACEQLRIGKSGLYQLMRTNNSKHLKSVATGKFPLPVFMNTSTINALVNNKYTHLTTRSFPKKQGQNEVRAPFTIYFSPRKKGFPNFGKPLNLLNNLLITR